MKLSAYISGDTTDFWAIAQHLGKEVQELIKN